MPIETFIVECKGRQDARFQHFRLLSDARSHAEKVMHDGLAEEAFIHAVATENTTQAIRMMKQGEFRTVEAKTEMLTAREKQEARVREWERIEKNSLINYFDSLNKQKSFLGKKPRDD